MLMAMLAALLLGGDGLSSFFLIDIEKPVEASVADPADVRAILSVRDALKDDLERFAEGQSELRGELLAAHLSPHAGVADFERVFQRLDQRRRRVEAAVMDAREKMRALMTREEWQAVFAPVQ